MAVTVHLRQLRISPRKVRLVTDVIRGKEVGEALEQLEYIPKRSSLPIIKLLKSGISAAEHDFKMNKNDLYISKIFVLEGPILKRGMPRAMGRSFPISKRTSYITIELDKKIGLAEPEKEVTPEPEKKTKKASKKVVKSKKAD